MSHSPTQPTGSGTPPGSGNGATPPLGLGALLRAGADGELSTVQQAELDRHLSLNPRDESRVRFEQGLRAACARVMGPSSPSPTGASASLRESILASMAARGAEPEPAPARIHERGRVEVRHHRWRRVRGFVALAAALPLLIAGWMIFGRTGDTGGLTEASILPVGLLAKEHCDCGTHTKIRPQGIGEVSKAVQSLVGKPVHFESLIKAGFELVGCAPCPVPGGKRSAQLLFRRARGDTSDAGEDRLSLFVQNDQGKNRLTQGITWDARNNLPPDGPCIRTWLSDNVVYYTVTNSKDTADRAREALNGPDNTEPLCGG